MSLALDKPRWISPNDMLRRRIVSYRTILVSNTFTAARNNVYDSTDNESLCAAGEKEGNVDAKDTREKHLLRDYLRAVGKITTSETGKKSSAVGCNVGMLAGAILS
jgi:hypothetical protein